MIVVGVILYILEAINRNKEKKNQFILPGGLHPTAHGEPRPEAEPTPAAGEGGASEEGEECCGLHITCEKDSLSPLSAEIEYYDDEELDRFIGRESNQYSPEEIEEFRDVLMTLQGEDIPGWARSVTARHLNLPDEIRDELLILVNEYRNK